MDEPNAQDKYPATGPAEVLAARFCTREEAEAIRLRLESMHYDPAELSYVSDSSKCSFSLDGIGPHAGRASLGGVVGGGTLGAGLSLTASALGWGSLVVLGPVGAATGAAVGGLIGLLLGAGLNSGAANACESAINEGSMVLVIQAHAGDQQLLRELLGDHLIGAERDTYLDEHREVR